MTDLLFTNAIVIIALMTFVWLISLPLKDVSIIDLVWGLGFVIVAWVSYVIASRDGVSCYLIPLLVTAWGVRLSGYLAWRNLGHGEDKRYAQMRERYGNIFPWLSYVIVFLLQGVVMWVVSLPVQLGIYLADGSFGLLHAIGSVVWAVGLFFEAVGDFQLARFKSKPENYGKVLDSGLWRYTRHPNYFGDFLIWWGFFIVAIASGAPWWTAVGPIVMSVFLMYVSGVTLLEKSLVTDKSGYTEYKRRTNAFFPWLPG